MLTLKLPAHNARKFTWSKGSNGKPMGVAEASDLGRWRSQVWADACDEGFYVQGRNELKLFVFSQELKDADGDVVAWVFEAHDGCGIEVHVLND